MLASSKLSLPVKDGRVVCGVRPNWRSSGRLPCAAIVARWTFGDVAEAIKKAVIKQKNMIKLASQRSPEKHLGNISVQRKSIPATFQRLSPDVVVLLDPKNDRLLYLVGVGVEEPSGADRVVEQLRALLRASAAPYVHLMALPARLRTTLLREFPGGSPIIGQVPLPRNLAPAPEQHAESEQRSDTSHPHLAQQHPHPQPHQLRQQQQPGGVLGLLYGPSASSPNGRYDHATGDGDSGAAAGQDLNPLARDGHDAGEVSGMETPEDVPDEIMSRPRKMMPLMAWLKGASTRVAHQRDRRTPYKFQDLISGFNRLGELTAFMLAPGVLLVRNAVADKMELDMSGFLGYAADPLGFWGFMDELMVDESDDEDEEEKEEGEEEAVAGAEDSDADQEEEEEGGDEEAGPGAHAVGSAADTGRAEAARKEFMELLQQLSISAADDSDNDDKDDEDDEKEPDDIIIIARDSDDNDEEEEEDEEEGEEAEGVTNDAGGVQILSLSPGNIRIVGDSDDSSDGDDSGDDESVTINLDDGDFEDPLEFNTEMRLMDGPMGWRAMLRVRPDHHSPGPVPAASSLFGGRSLDPVAESQRAEAEYLANRQMLEDLWHKQAEESEGMAELHGPEPDEGKEGGDSGPHAHSGGGISALGADSRQTDSRGAAGSTTTGWARLHQPSSSSAGGGGASDSDGVVPGPSGKGSQVPIPTDRLIRPSRRPGASGPTNTRAVEGESPASQGPSSSSPHTSAAGGTVASSSTRGVGDLTAASSSAQPGSATATPGPIAGADGSGGFVGSTRMRRGPAHGRGMRNHGGGSSAGPAGSQHQEQGQPPDAEPDDSSDATATSSSSGGQGKATGATPGPRIPGRSRMVRRLRRPPIRAGGHAQPGPADTPSGSGAGSSPSAPTSASHHSGYNSGASPSASGRHSDAPASAGGASAGTNAAADAAAITSPGIGGAIPVPAHKHLRQPGPGANAGASSNTPGNPHPLSNGMTKPQWSRLAPHQAGAPTTPGTSNPAVGAGGGGAATGGGGSGSSPTPQPTPAVPPEAAGYTAMDMDQMAHLVLGRQGTPEEVQDLARAVAQSAEVEEMFAGGAAANPGQSPPPSSPQQQQPQHFLGYGVSRYRWRRPGTPPPTYRERLRMFSSSGRRSVVTPRSRRLRIPPRVFRLLGPEPRELDGGADEPAGPVLDEEGVLGLLGAGRREPLLGPMSGGFAGTRAGRMAAAEYMVAQMVAQAAVRPTQRRASTQPAKKPEPRADEELKAGSEEGRDKQQEALVEAAVQAFFAAPQLEQQQAEALLAFLRGRSLPPWVSQQGQDQDLTAGRQAMGRQSGRVKAAERRRGLLGSRSRGGLPGLTRGRDAVVVLPRGMLDVAAGAWQQAEERLMHPDLLGGWGRRD